jgi:hypothetical protein
MLIRAIESGKYKESGLAVGICSYSQVLKKKFPRFFSADSRITMVGRDQKNWFRIFHKCVEKE